MFLRVIPTSRAHRRSSRSASAPSKQLSQERPKSKRVLLMGAPFAAVTESEAARAIVEAAVASRGHWTVTANLDHVRRYRRDAGIRQLVDEADMLVADGTPLVWASRLAGDPLPERVAGSNMVWSVSRAASRDRASLFLLGGDPGVADQAARRLRERYPDLEIVGTFCPPLGFEHDEREFGRVEARIRESKPQIVLVALGFPKQDIVIKRLRSIAPQASYMGVGIALSFVAGELSRAPEWMHRLGLEWLYRLLQDPKRLARRYLIDGLPFAMQLFCSATLDRLLRGNRRFQNSDVG